MGDIDTKAVIKKGCSKRLNESPVFSVESILMNTTGGDPLVPITPHSKREGLNYRLVLDHSPSPLAFPNQQLVDCDSHGKGGGYFKHECDSLPPFSSPNQKLVQCDSQLEDGGFSSENSLHTPKRDVFDPFAQFQDKPHFRKCTEESKVSVAQKLKFDQCTKFVPKSEDLTVSEEEILFQSVYSNILEAIISMQTKENGKVSCELPFSDGYQTPIIVPLLTGIADTCPGAPLKFSSRFRRIDKEICRKIEF